MGAGLAQLRGGRANRLLPVAAPLAPRVDHGAGGHHQAPRRVVAEGGGEISGAAALGTHARQQQHLRGHQLAGALDSLRVGRADHGANAREPGFADQSSAPLRDQLGRALPQRPAVEQQFLLEVGGAGVGRPGQHEQSGALATCGKEGLHRVAAHVGIDGEGVGNGASAVARRQPRLGVCLGRRSDVAALGVGDHEQAALGGDVTDTLERRQPVPTQRLEESHLRLDRDGLVGDRVDQALAEPLVGACAAGPARLQSCHQLRRQQLDPRIEPDAERAALAGNGLGQAVCEVHRLKGTRARPAATSVAAASSRSTASGIAVTSRPGRAKAAVSRRAVSA